MRLFSRAAIALLLAIALPGLLWAQEIDPNNPVKIASDNTAFGGTSAEFLQFGSGARGMALGGSFSTIVDDVNALYYNPAGLTSMQGPEVALTLMPYFADTDYYWTGLAFPFSDGDFGMGFFLGHFGFGNQPIYTEADPDNVSGETYGVNETVAGLSFAHAFIDRFSAGLTLKFINDDLATGALGGASASAAAIDFGVNFHSELGNRPIRLAFVVQNLGGSLAHEGEALRFRDINGSDADVSIPDQRQDPPAARLVTDAFPLPRLFRVGLNYDIISGESSNLSLMGEFIESNNTNAAFGFAGEYRWTGVDVPVGVALRASFQTQPDNAYLGGTWGTSEGIDGLGLGGGLFYRFADRYRIQFDYAYKNYGVLGSANAFTVGLGVD
ncbi:MAG: PorV/PorQ family protein [Candidatus Palauibacterales bacterium]|nr:PorV/PorQ family protein [Candidatus Palauibacterales bacterium]MDP2483964.1 PorV/PorQ family protein [Candidatus Palauibacterales bacterium]